MIVAMLIQWLLLATAAVAVDLSIDDVGMLVVYNWICTTKEPC